MDANVRSRFLREGYVANKVGHPDAVSVLDDDENEDGTVFLVMELLEGQTVEKLAESSPGHRLSYDEVLGIADGLLDVLVAAQAAGIVHRDLKPENLFLTTDGALKVLDFGIARLHDPSGSSHGTRTGDAFGTPAFMPPEQALGEWHRVDGRTDLWAVGATMFRLLTGRCVHEAENVQKTMLAAMTKPAPALASVLPGVPLEVAAVVDRALAFDPNERWPNATAMQEAVRQARSGALPANAGPVVSAAPPSATAQGGETETVTAIAIDAHRRRRTKRRTITIAAGALVVTLGVGALITTRLRSGPSASGSAEPKPREPDVAPASQPPASLAATATAEPKAPTPTSAAALAPSASASATARPKVAPNPFNRRK